MKLNGNVNAALLAFILTSTLGWGVYVSRSIAAQDVKIEKLGVAFEERSRAIEKQLDALAKKSDIADLRIVIREALASALGKQ